MATAEMLKKLTLKACGAQPTTEMVAKLEKLAEKDKKAGIDLLDIFGIARKFKPGTSNFGDFLKFSGSFKAINLQTKEQYQSGVVILPKFLEDQLFSVMGGDVVNDVQFAFRISVRFDADTRNARHYTYQAQSLLKPSEADPLAALEKVVNDERKALAAPK